jgi:NADH-quinone oxidoreductase subunit G
VGSNVRWEAALLNVRLRKAVKAGAKVYIIGPEWDPTYPATFLGSDLKLLNRIPKDLGDAMKAAKRPAVILGAAALAKGALPAALKLVDKFDLLRDDWNGFNVLHISAARMASLMLGFTLPGGMGDIHAAKPKVLLSLGADEMDYAPYARSLKVYIGHHGDKGAHHADIILPGASYAEKDGTYVNTEGRVQFAEKAVFAPGDAREDWTILRALADALGVTVGFDSFEQLQAQMIAAVPALGEEGLADVIGLSGGALPKADSGAKFEGEIAGYPVKDFYLTNPIARASAVMQRCSDELLHGADVKEAAE